jgi:hypothetical protein
MSVALYRFSPGENVVLNRTISDNARRFNRGEILRVATRPYDRTYTLEDRDGHTLHRVSEHDLLGRDESSPVGWNKAKRVVLSLLARIFPGSEA